MFGDWALPAYAHTKTQRFSGGAADESVWINGDLEMLSRCDAIICLAGSEQSEGVRNELSLAGKLKLPVHESVEALRKWLESQAAKPEKPVETKDGPKPPQQS
jgi:hypothetical protein